MDIQEAKQVCETFAAKHGVKFTCESSIGFGRECAGFVKDEGFIEYNPINMTNYDYVFDKQMSRPECAPNAYHKHTCLAVLAGADYAGSLDAAIIELAQWVKAWEDAGELELVRYRTGAMGLQAMPTGAFGWAIRYKDLHGA